MLFFANDTQQRPTALPLRWKSTGKIERRLPADVQVRFDISVRLVAGSTWKWRNFETIDSCSTLVPKSHERYSCVHDKNTFDPWWLMLPQSNPLLIHGNVPSILVLGIEKLREMFLVKIRFRCSFDFRRGSHHMTPLTRVSWRNGTWIRVPRIEIPVKALKVLQVCFLDRNIFLKCDKHTNKQTTAFFHMTFLTVEGIHDLTIVWLVGSKTSDEVVLPAYSTINSEASSNIYIGAEFRLICKVLWASKRTRQVWKIR